MTKGGDKPTIFVRVVQGGFVPATPIDAERHAELRQGATVEISPEEPHSGGQRRLYWWMLGKVVPNQSTFPNAKAMSKAILHYLGYFERTLLLGGNELIEPQSISGLSREEMSELIEGAKLVIETEIAPGLDVDALLSEGRKSTRGIE